MKKLEKTLTGLTDLRSILRTIKKFAESKEFQEYAEKSAMKMVTSLFSDAGKTWREAARKNSKGKEIYEALRKEFNTPIGLSVREQIERNATLIKSMPKSISKEITEHVASETLKGRRAEYIAKDLQKMYPHMMESKAKLIARTEVSKTSTALTKARCENLGLNWYIWRTSEDQRVRSSHSHMEGVLVCWNNPPSPEMLIGEKFVGYYNAGNIYNCRCYPEVVIKLDFISWPHKVYYNGTIQTMTRKQFETIAA
jgi:SPP1 gp7 family putative phage head morphogenesis protein